MGVRAATAVANELLRSGAATALYRCLKGEPDAAGRASVSGRQFIEDTRRLKSSYEYVVVDLSGASDQIAAIAFASADLILVPFLPHEANAEPFVRTIELLDILSSHREQPLRHAVFLASSERIGPGLHLEISGQFIRRGLSTLAVPLRERQRESSNAKATARPQAELGNNGNLQIANSDISRFVACTLDAVLHCDQPVMPRALALG